jgi:light-regulated signal transduction histidine kinase (bacteriophytochrome)
MVDGALRMGSLIDDLLVFTRLDRTEPELETIDMNVLVNEVVESLEKDLMALKGAVTVGDLPELEVDPAELKRVFRRLLDNAIRYHKDEPPIIRVGATEANGCWVFSVSDNGIGIDPEFTEKIFGVFERLHTPETYPGTGMGLALCKKIVERHGGGVWVESEKGVGSVFYFTISSR